MAAKTNRVEVEIVATDEASPKIDKLEAKIHNLEADEARIVVTSNIERTTKQLDEAQKKLDQLDGDEATVQARLVGNLEQDLEQAEALFNQLDGKTGTVTMKLDDQQMRDGTRRASEGVNEITDSARGANSALANMVGNTAQDLGAMGGVAGSAGVAIGQMAEYAADARLAGEGLGSALASMAAVAGPIAAVSIALAGINSILNAMKDGQAVTKAFDDKQVKEFTEAVQEGDDTVQGYNETIKKTGEVLADTGQKAGPAWAQILPGVDEITRVLGLMGKFGENIDDILPQLNEAGISSDAWFNIISSPVPGLAMDNLRRKLDASNLSTEDQHRILIAARAAQENYNTSVDKAAAAEQFLGTAINDRTTAQQMLNNAMGIYIGFLRDRHNAAADEIAEAQRRINELERSRQLRDAFIELNVEETKHLQAVERRQAAGPIITTAELANIDKAAEGIHDLAESLDDIESGALAKVFDTGNSGVDALTAIQNVNQGLRDLAEFIRDDLKGVIPNTLDPNDINADDFLNKFAAIRRPIQQQLEQTFADLGADAARAQAESWVNTIAAQTGIKKDEIRRLLGLDDLEAKIKVSVDEADTEKARRLLDLLARFPNASLGKQAQIALGLELGTLDPKNAIVLIEDQIDSEMDKLTHGKGFEVATALGMPTNTDEVIAAAERDLAENPAELPVVLSLPAGELDRLQALMQLALGANVAIPSGRFPTVTNNNTVINPPGTPPTTFQQYNDFVRLNGAR